MASRVFSPLKAKGQFNPETFSLALLEKEIELEKNFNKFVIEDLITLYSEAIEYYNEQSDPKFYDYQHKLQSLLLKPEVSSILNNKDMKNFYNFTKRKNLLSQALARTKILQYSKNIFSKKIVKENSGALVNSIRNSVSSQEKNLNERIQARKLKNQESFEVPKSLNSSLNLKKTVPKSYDDTIKAITLSYLTKIESASEAEKKSLAEEMKQKILQVSKTHKKLQRSLIIYNNL